MKGHKWLVCTFPLFLLAGCAFENTKLARFNREAGYRLANLSTNSLNSEELFVVLSFSGGGTRAAAFSYGALQELARTPITSGGTKRRLLDEVDIISSISGGSFTAGYYGLYGERIFEDFDSLFLKRNVQFALALRVLNPVNWPRLGSPYFDRIDLAAEYYDTLLFKHHTYQDLLARARRPLIVINATDMSLGSRFEFTQEQFDLLYSDLNTYPVSRAVAASSAFPVLLSPVTLRNYPDRPDFVEPIWITTGLQDIDENSRRFKIASVARSYEDATNRPYIHLLDGGISDNLGLRGPARSLLSTDGQDSILRKINRRQVKKIVIITVNAKPGEDVDADKHRRAPGLLGVLATATSAPMENYSLETIDSLSDKIDEMVKAKQTETDVLKELKQKCPDVKWPEVLPSIDFYNIELSFDRVADLSLRKRLKALPTSFHLKPADIDLLKQAAGDLLRQSPKFRELVNALN
ncbi:MAG TPA: patatin-like phospholipase family protein [Candidatus Binatia bacterium]|nr:patatin-like phospholipase family protein [Candidatus Binatia bacterium]